MNRSRIAAQLYTVRRHLTDARDFARTLCRLREIGYEAVQLSGGPDLAATVLRRILDDAGMRCCATHENSDLLLNEPFAVADRLHTLGCTLTAYPYPAGVDLTDPSALARLAERLEAAATVLNDAGCQLGYHHHDLEFVPGPDGNTVLDYLLDQAPHLVAELDTFWVQAGGGDVVAWIQKLTGRLPFIHLKDFGLKPPRERIYAEIGSGNLAWNRILPAAVTAGCTWFIVERDDGEVDPFISLQRSFDYLTTHFFPPDARPPRP